MSLDITTLILVNYTFYSVLAGVGVGDVSVGHLTLLDDESR